MAAESTIVEIEPPVGASSNTNGALIATGGQKKFRSIPPIHKVPASIRKWNEDQFSPRELSIGPYQCTKREGFYGNLANSISKGNEKFVQKLVRTVTDEYFDIRHYYTEDIDPYYVTEKLFIRDANLIIEILLATGAFSDSYVPIDLLLLENQLPFFLIEEVFRHKFRHPSSSLIELTFDFFKEFNVLNIKPSDLKVEIEQFTDLLRTFYLPPSRQLPKRGEKKIELKYTATRLQEAGVRFEASSSNCILDFKFDSKTGLLQIPCLDLLRDKTEVVVRNVLALEQTRYEGKEYVSDYFLMMSSLIQSTEDMALLHRLRIVFTDQYDDTKALEIVQSLRSDIKSKDMNHDYNHICEKLNKFRNRPRSLMRIWKKPLKRDYCSDPWRTASTIAAILFLIFTLTQTVCSVIQTLH